MKKNDLKWNDLLVFQLIKFINKVLAASRQLQIKILEKNAFTEL